MKRILATVCLCITVLNCHGDVAAVDGSDDQLVAAKAAVKMLAGALQAELKTAMQSGGPVAAIQVCNTRAMPLTQQLAGENDMQLARVSRRNRNPANTPNDWQSAVLEDFERQRTHGQDVNTLAWSETAEVDGVKEYRFMKAIPTGGVCLACHGTQLSPEITRVLAELYPADLATGYSEGDIRGAFVVTRTLSK